MTDNRKNENVGLAAFFGGAMIAFIPAIIGFAFAGPLGGLVLWVGVWVVAAGVI